MFTCGIEAKAPALIFREIVLINMIELIAMTLNCVLEMPEHDEGEEANHACAPD